MAHIFANGVLETCTLTGTGSATLTGAVPGFRTFASKCAVNDTVHYRIEAVNGLGVPTGLWEVGRGTYSATNTLARTTVLESSNANALENFAGAVRVSITVLSPTTSLQVALDWITGLGAVDTTNVQSIGGVKTFTANPVITTGSDAILYVNGNGTGNYAYVALRHAGVDRWRLLSEATSNNFSLHRLNSAGTFLTTPMVVSTSNGDITLNTGGGWLYSKGKIVSGPIASTMATSDSGNSIEIQNNGGTGDTNMAMMAFHCTGTYAIKMGLRADGYFGIGGWSRAAWSVYTAPDGSWYASGNVSAYSDETLKTNWKDLPRNYVARLARVRHGVYDRIDKKNMRQVGVGAQSLRKLLPWAVTKGIDGILAVSYGPAALASAVALAKDFVALRLELHAERKARKAMERRLDRFEKVLKELTKVKKK